MTSDVTVREVVPPSDPAVAEEYAFFEEGRLLMRVFVYPDPEGEPGRFQRSIRTGLRLVG